MMEQNEIDSSTKPEIKDSYQINDLRNLLAFLRSPEGCPWDRIQTHDSIKHNLIEEAYEVVDAIQSGNSDSLKDELGDLLMQVVFHARMAEERGEFDFDDVVTAVSQKLISRHTHIFGDDIAANPEQVLQTWEENKKIEKGLHSQTDVLCDVPRTLPALTRAFKVQKKAAQVGFDWPDSSGSKAKIFEELDEIQEQIDLIQVRLRAENIDGNTVQQREIEQEAGDLLFAVVNYLRSLKVEPELALNLSTDNFIRRFAQMEALAAASDTELDDLSLTELDALWNQAKQILGQMDGTERNQMTESKVNGKEENK